MAAEQKACTADGTCWRLQDRRAIERIAADGAWVDELRLSDAELSDIRTGCARGSIGVLASITATDINGEPQVVASLGAGGAVVRQGDGTWERVRVLSVPRVEAGRAESLPAGALLFFGPVLALFVWIVGRRRWPSWKRGLAVTGTGWLATIQAAAAIGLMAGPDTEPTRIIGRVATAGMAVTTIAAIVLARRPVRRRRPVAFPPPRPDPKATP